jgi:hypothetical protein
VSKVRRIDWSPDEWIAGTFGVLTVAEAAVYMAALMVIYSRGGHCPNDAAFIAGHFKPGTGRADRRQARLTMLVRDALDRLIELGKLNPTPDRQWLTNGRANAELSKAGERIVGAARAGIASGAARRAQARSGTTVAPQRHHSGTTAQGELLPNNDLGRTTVRNHQPPSESESESVADTSAEAARVRERSLALPLARDSEPKPMTPAKPPTMAERLAILAQARRGQQDAQPKPKPKPKSKSAERLEALAAEARAKLLSKAKP